MGAGSNGIIFDDLEWPQPGFQDHGIVYRMEPFSMTLSDLWPQFPGHDIFLTLNISETTRERAMVTIEPQ